MGCVVQKLNSIENVVYVAGNPILKAT